jgi:ATP-dependent Lon protease
MEEEKRNDKLQKNEDNKSSVIVVDKKVKVVSQNSKKELQEQGKSMRSVIRIAPLKNTVLFPHNVMPLASGKEWSNEAVDKALRIGGTIGVLAYKETHDDQTPDVSIQDFHVVGTEAKVLKILKFPDRSSGALLHGVRRFRVINLMGETHDDLTAEVEFFDQEQPKSDNLEIAALGKAIKQLVSKAIGLSPHIPNEAALFIDNVQDIPYLSDLIVPYLSIDFEERQALLEIEDLETRLRQVHYFLSKEIEVLEISQKINTDVKTELNKQQRKYYVREQMKVLQKELGDLDGRAGGSHSADPQDLHEKVMNSKMPLEAREAALREVERLNMMQVGAPEYMVSHTYVSWLLDLPWETFTQGDIDLKKAEEVLNQDHYGLKKVKKRILEFLAVCALKKSLKGPILLFVGPPGVGKTSLGKSIATALGRKFSRIALGGVRDEAEMRGHRRTYVGSMPGKIVDTLKKTGSMDPVILFDEIDKLASDGRGDPASALLEILDPEQNHTFVDHYLGVSVDLSKVFFIATANNLYNIPAPLRDRMEVIELSSYTLDEKTHIAFSHLLPQVVEENGLKDLMDVQVNEDIMKNVIQLYTREAGVRQLKRELSGITRGLARECVEKGIEKQKKSTVRKVTKEDVRNYLGPQIFSDKKKPLELPVGTSTGLAWTPNGGDVLYIETALSESGNGKFALTGQLGDVMKESVQTALAYIRSNSKKCGVDLKKISKRDLHVHFPEGAVKKDGPSAGVAAFLGMVSQFSGRSVASDLAMTGEISLRGDVLAVGGIKEKLLAAHRYGIKQVMIPEENTRDLEEIPKEVLSQMKVLPVSHLSEVLKIAFSDKKKKSKSRATVKRK